MPDPRVALGIFTLVSAAALLVFWPGNGLLARWRKSRSMSERIVTEDALKHLHNFEMAGRRPTVESLAGALHVTVNEASSVLNTMEAGGLVVVKNGDFRLTPQGRESALHIIRAHRLWERYLADKTGYTEVEWHQQAELFEHRLLPAEVEALSAQLGNPTYDPHGDPIPDSGGSFVAHGGQSLMAMPVDESFRIVHIEDEPEAVFAQLVAEGFYPGMEIRLIEMSPHRVRIWADGDEHLLAPIVAANISVRPLERAAAAEPQAGEPLSVLKLGEHGQVVGLSPRCRGPERRRMMDLGILPGTVVTAELISPSGDPTAYRIRDALIALRVEQAQLINISRLPEGAR
jgi:DtxR family transcriptional regulator, Mn-dependent transcriptional regulator